MKNPFRSEAEAFRFVLWTAVYFAAIAIAAAAGGFWWGLGVFVVLTILVGVWFFRRERHERPPVSVPARRRAEDERRILVVANETVAGAALREEIRSAVEGGAKASVLVVSPALNSPIRHWASDEDQARAAAEERLGRSIAELERLGIPARGEVGDADPVQAIEDALRTFGADLIVISTHPEGRSNWLERGVVTSARERFTVPITHVVVDLEAETATVEPRPI